MNELDQAVLGITWPPPYKIKRHRRARYVKLRANQLTHLDITVPYRFNLKDIPEILEKNRVWIIKQLARLQQKITALPSSVELKACDQNWSVHYMACDMALEIIERPNQGLVLVGKIDDQAACKKLLMKWVRLKAKAYLSEQLHNISQKAQLPFQKLTIRQQKSLWGSCTSKHAISLNFKLIFLPRELMSHVLIHELCHTKHLNHSIRFWNLVAKYDENWQENRHALRRADEYLPGWIS